MKLLIRWIFTALSLGAAVWLVDGIQVDGPGAVLAIGVMALILTLAHGLVQAILALVPCGCVTLTMGLSMLAINAAALWLFAQLAGDLGIGFYIDTYRAAFLGGLIVSGVSLLLSILIPTKRD